ncbi:hypothetical protein TNCV_1999341 [Trichonephila clavipes]|nr:hypothetical protein TNCV_1999341 [Trichonephila clavipes]
MNTLTSRTVGQSGAELGETLRSNHCTGKGPSSGIRIGIVDDIVLWSSGTAIPDLELNSSCRAAMHVKSVES